MKQCPRPVAGTQACECVCFQCYFWVPRDGDQVRTIPAPPRELERSADCDTGNVRTFMITQRTINTWLANDSTVARLSNHMICNMSTANVKFMGEMFYLAFRFIWDGMLFISANTLHTSITEKHQLIFQTVIQGRIVVNLEPISGKTDRETPERGMSTVKSYSSILLYFQKNLLWIE